MMGLDAARAADPIVSINKNPGEGLVSARKDKKKDGSKTPPVFSSQDNDLKIQVPEGWHTL